MKNINFALITTAELEEMELKRMKNNAFYVAKEVAERVDGDVAPGGYIKSFVTLQENKLFFWDKKYLAAFTERKLSEVVPGHNYFSKIEEFTKLHVVVGEKYIEFIKFGCKDVHGDICKFCSVNSWNDIECCRIPEPMPDYNSEKFAYLHANKTPHEIDGIKRKVNDYNPRVQLQRMCQENTLKFGDSDKVEEFSKTYIVSTKVINNALQELSYRQVTKEVKKREQLNKRKREKSCEDINWLEVVESNQISHLLVQTIDKYLIEKRMLGCLKLKKNSKIDAIRMHVRSTYLKETLGTSDEQEQQSDREGPSSDSDDEEDEV